MLYSKEDRVYLEKGDLTNPKQIEGITRGAVNLTKVINVQLPEELAKMDAVKFAHIPWHAYTIENV